MTAAELQRQVAALAERVAALEAKRPAKVVVGYVIKVGNEYATGLASMRVQNPEQAYRFTGTNAKRAAQIHRDACHKGGRLVRVTRRVRP